MKKLISILLAVALALPVVASLDVVGLGYGDVFTPVFPARVAAVRAVSSVASGTVALKSVSSLDVVESKAVVTADTNFTYTVVATNYVSGALETTTNTVAYDPYPFGHANWISFTTNSIVYVTTNYVPTATSTVTITNALDSLTCSGGVGASNPTNLFLVPGEPVHYEGSARGRVTLILER